MPPELQILRSIFVQFMIMRERHGLLESGKVVLTLDLVNKILTSDHSNKISLSLVVYSALSIFEHFPV